MSVLLKIHIYSDLRANDSSKNQLCLYNMIKAAYATYNRVYILSMYTCVCTILFGKAKCRLCGDNVRFALRHLKESHPETMKDFDVMKLNMPKIMERYFK